jgi:hypothetical protein
MYFFEPHLNKRRLLVNTKFEAFKIQISIELVKIYMLQPDTNSYHRVNVEGLSKNVISNVLIQLDVFSKDGI